MHLCRANRINEARDLLLKEPEYGKHLGSLYYSCGELSKAFDAWRSVDRDEEVQSLLI